MYLTPVHLYHLNTTHVRLSPVQVPSRTQSAISPLMLTKSIPPSLITQETLLICTKKVLDIPSSFEETKAVKIIFNQTTSYTKTEKHPILLQH